jgi:hypothetical protein
MVGGPLSKNWTAPSGEEKTCSLSNTVNRSQFGLDSGRDVRDDVNDDRNLDEDDVEEASSNKDF